MTEQERAKETRIQFPQVPKKYFDEVMAELSEFSTDSPDSLQVIDHLSEFFIDEPFLASYVVTLSISHLDLKSAQEFIFGAIAMHRVLRKLKNKGVILSSVSKDTIVSQQAEIRFFNVGSSEPLKYSEIGQVLVSENPELPELLRSLPKTMRPGALTVYGLKRRQFHADQLAKQFGG